MDIEEEPVATLILSEDYLHQLNDVARVTTRNIILLKRKFISKSGWELVPIPLSECTGITFRSEFSMMRIVVGVLVLALLGLIVTMLVMYWSALQPSTKLPASALGLAGIFGLNKLVGGRRHHIQFSMLDGSTLHWKSLAGDYQIMQLPVDRLKAFARTRSLLMEPAN